MSRQAMEMLRDNLSGFKQWFEDTALPLQYFARDIHQSGDVAECFMERGEHPGVVFKVRILDSMRSHYDRSHAGALTTLVDWLTAVAGAGDPKYMPTDRPATVEDYKYARKQLGLSRQLSLHYLKEVPVGTEVFVRCVMLENTATRQYFTVDVYDGDNDYVRGTHDKIKLYKRVNKRADADRVDDAFGNYQDKSKL